MMRRWRQVPKIPKPHHRDGFRDLTLYSVNHGERIRVFPFLPDGSLDPEVLDEIKRLFRDKELETMHPVHPRLVKLLYRLADQLEARQITVICGYREALDKNEGNHTRGRAVDLVLPGVSLVRLAQKARQLGHVGVGLYPNSGFVHLDVRDGPSFFWTDRSGPGKSSCLRRTLTKTARKFDRRWRPDHDEPERHRNRKGELLGATEVAKKTLDSSDEQTESKTDSTRGL